MPKMMHKAEDIRREERMEGGPEEGDSKRVTEVGLRVEGGGLRVEG